MSVSPRRFRHPLRWLGLLVVGGQLVACGGTTARREPLAANEERRVGFVVVDQGQEAPPEAAAEAAEPDVDAVVPMDPAPLLALLDPGSDAMLLDYHLSPGQRDRVQMHWASETHSRINNARQPELKRDIRMTFDLGPVQRTRDGYRVPYRMTAAVASPETNAPADYAVAARDIVQEIVGMHGLLVVDARGRSLGISLAAPDAVSPITLEWLSTVRSWLRGVFIQLPLGPVGVGATWRDPPQTDDAHPSPITTVHSIDGDGVELRERGERAVPSITAFNNGHIHTEPTRAAVTSRYRLNLGALAQAWESESTFTTTSPVANSRSLQHHQIHTTLSMTPLGPSAGDDADHGAQGTSP